MMQGALGKFTPEGYRAAQEAIAQRIGPGIRKVGGPKAEQLVAKLANKVNTLLANARAQGKWHPTSQLTKGGDKLAGRAGLNEGDRIDIWRWNTEVTQGRQELTNPEEVNALRQRYDEEAKALRNMVKAGNKLRTYVPPGTQLRAQWAEATADHLRSLLQNGRVSQNAIPGLKEAQSRLGKAITLRDALVPAELKASHRVLPYLPGSAAAVGGAMLPAQSWQERAQHAAVLGAVMSPQGLSNIALHLATNPALTPLLTALMRGSTMQTSPASPTP
jgi:hypothetical protein